MRNYSIEEKTSLYRALNQLSFAVTSVFGSIKAGKADAVLTTSPPILISMFGWLIAKVKDAKLIYDVRDIWPDVAIEMGSFTQKSLYYKIFDFIARFMFDHAGLITTVSPGKVEKIKSKLPESKWKKIWLVENGLDETFVKKMEDTSVNEEYDLKSKFTCVYIGNIGFAQGLGHLLDLAEKVDKEKFQFLLFGQGAEKEKLENEAKKRNLMNVRFCGVVDRRTVYSILKNASMTYIPLVNSNLKDSIFSHYNSEVYRSKGKPRLSMLSQGLHLVFLIGILVWLAPQGFSILCFGRSMARLQLIILNMIVIWCCFGISAISVFKNIHASLIATLCMGIIGLGLQQISATVIWNFISIAICVCVYFAVLLMFPKMREELMALPFVKKLLRK